ncbi:hypothetical protein B0H15DRAFT_917544 [Mycena belliarum]|uniref:MYND-type domain-containing protein n=1 Tax=Mycena belliarum TaxID=1033014 RepID=A0AAD6XIP7_9AGAR|nr:hypothetical protein B0H15DRAFT_917544 [Mycena belliae]
MNPWRESLQQSRCPADSRTVRHHSHSRVVVQTPLDLYAIALLLNYERASTEPRFRHAKLIDIATTSDSESSSRVGPVREIVRSQQWVSRTGPKDGFVFEKLSSAPRDEPDLPANMLPSPIPDGLKSLTPKNLETIFWQARGHDGCYKSVTLLQHFFDLYPPDMPLRVRTSAGADYLTSASTRVILELKLLKPKLMTIAHVVGSRTYITGAADTMMHAVAGFAESQDGNVATILDLASLQFGDAGRGVGGRSTFALESLDAFYDRVETIAVWADTDNARTSARIGPCSDDAWLKQVARRAKARWDTRDTHAWCGHCGGPGAELKKCSLCREEAYCNGAHQAAAWPYHKRFCAGRKK